MSDAIVFPHLGVTLEHVGSEISLGSFTIAYYGITLAVAMLVGITLTALLAKIRKADPDPYLDCGFLAIVFALVGARLYYVAFRWEFYRDDLLQILNFRGGGLAIYGGILGGLLAVILYSAKKKHSVLDLCDFISCGLVIGQIIGRWGNFFNREAFGNYTDSLLAMRIPLSAVRASDLTQKILDNTVTVQGTEFIQVHPTFLYESLWNLAVLLVMVIVLMRRSYEGQVVSVYLAGYGLGRLWIEGLRTDSLLIPGTAIAVSQVVSGVIVLIALLGFAILGKRNRDGKKLKPNHSKQNPSKRVHSKKENQV